jgi:DNA-directed RNA polymerase specialized sigma24 family protein
MRRGAEGTPATDAGGFRLRNIKLDVGRDSDADDEELPADERLDRMLGDQDLLLQLQLSSYAPEYWAPASAEFARYGHDVLVGWLLKNKMFTQVYQKTKRRPRPPDEPFDDDAVQSLATDTVIAALDAFLELVLKQNKWQASGGASLKTFFIGQCCFQFTNVYRKWWRAERRRFAGRDAADWLLTEKLNEGIPEPDEQMISDEEVAAAMGLLSTEVAQNAFAMNAAGFTHAEVAATLGLADDKAVENLLNYQRRRISKTARRGAGR